MQSKCVEGSQDRWKLQHHPLDKTLAETLWEGAVEFFTGHECQKVKCTTTANSVNQIACLSTQSQTKMHWFAFPSPVLPRRVEPTHNKPQSPPQIDTELCAGNLREATHALRAEHRRLKSPSNWISSVSLVLLVLLNFCVLLFHCVHFQETCLVTAGENTMFPVMLLH